MKKNSLKFTGERLIPKDNENQAFYYEHFLRYNFATQFSKSKIVLDVACGTGYGCQLISKKGEASKVTGIDISSESIKFAKKNYQENNIDYLVDDAQTLISQKNNSFDLITSFETIEHISNPEEFIKQTKKLLKKDGILIISTPNTNTYPKGNKYHIREQTPKEFYSLLKKYYTYTENYYQKFYLSNLISKKEETILNNIDKKIEVDDTNCEYLICVCSNQKIPITNNGIINNINKVEQVDLTNGYISVSNKFSNLYKQNENLTEITNQINQEKKKIQSDLNISNKENEILEQNLSIINQEKKKIQSDLNKIQSSKTYKLWQKFNKIKKTAILPCKLILFPCKYVKYFLKATSFFINFEIKKIFIKKTELKYLEDKFNIDGVTFIIPTWNKEEMVVNCVNNLIEKLEKEYKNIPKEIIVVDNGSMDNTTKSIKNIKSTIPINVISLKKNIGFGPAINLATEKSKYNYVYLLNNDMFPQDGFFSEIINFANNLIKNKKPFFGLSSQIFFYDKTKRREESGKTYITPKFGFINVAHCVNESNLKDNSITAYPGGGSSLINKYIFKEIGYYDYKSYTPLYCEDLDSGFVTWKIGFPSYYVANSHVIHHHRSSSKQLSIDPDFIMHKNWLTFILKNINNKSIYIKQIFSYSLLCVLDKKYREYANEVFKNKNSILISKLFLAKFKNKYNEKDLINFIDFETKHEF